MNVLYVLKRYPRLSETFVVREIVELERSGVQVAIDALLPPEDGPRHPMVDQVQALVRYLPRRPGLRDRNVLLAHARCFIASPTVWVREARRARTSGTWRRFMQAGLVARRLRCDGIQTVHAHFATAASEVAGYAAALAGVPFTVTAHAKDIFTHENATQLARRVGQAATVVTVSDHNRVHLSRVLPGTPVRVIRNGVPTAPVALGPQNAGPILCVARLVDKKGIDLLLEAVAIVHRARRGVRLDLIGDGPLRSELERHAVALGLGDVVTFHGAQPSSAVERAYGRCSMVVLPCRVSQDGDRDGLPTVLVEAMAHALPVISTDVVGIRELVRDEDTGLLVPAEDADALAAAITRLMDDPDLGRRLGVAGRHHAMSDYDPARSAKDLAALFAAVSS